MVVVVVVIVVVVVDVVVVVLFFTKYKIVIHISYTLVMMPNQT